MQKKRKGGGGVGDTGKPGGATVKAQKTSAKLPRSEARVRGGVGRRSGGFSLR